MRRVEFEVTDMERIAEVLGQCEYGTLSLIAEGKPYGVALNFVFHDGKICFHGAKEGRKAEAIAADQNASFLAVRPLSLIPSYFSDTRSACPATHYFASVHIEGEVEAVTGSDEKSRILGALMEKLQGEGGYEPISPDNPIYTRMLDQTAVYALTPGMMTMKVKAGQNLTQSRFDALTAKLESRGEGEDYATIAFMKEYYHAAADR